MIVVPVSKTNYSIDSGDTIEIEKPKPAEILPECFCRTDSLVKAWNPVFDVTPAELITAIVTERGVVLNPAEQGGVRSLL